MMSKSLREFIYGENKQAGRKEVVEWIKKNSYAKADYNNEGYLRCSWLELSPSLWQAKLKEWGLENEN